MNSDTFPNAIIYPAHNSNFYLPSGHGGVPNKPRGLVLHTPQEPADNYAYTPVFFADPNRQASTHYFVSFIGDLYQMVPENSMAIANGVIGKPYPSWADPATSLNWQSLSIEIEGFAETIWQTCPRGSQQWNTVAIWVAVLCGKYHIPLDRAHVIGHYQVSNNRTDPGTLNIDQIVQDAQALVLPVDEGEEDDVVSYPWLTSKDPTPKYRTYIIVGGCKRFVVSKDHEDMLKILGLLNPSNAPAKVSTNQLKAFPSLAGTPEPDAL